MEKMDCANSSAGSSMVIPALERKFDVRVHTHEKLDFSEFLNYLRTNTHIKRLYIQYTKLDGEESEKSSSILTLDSIPFTVTNDDDIITDADDRSVKCLSQLTNLTELSLVGDFINDAFVKLLSETNCFHNIKHLELSKNNIGDQSASALADSHNFPNLTDLVLHNTNIGLQGAKELALSYKLKNLQTVNLNESDMHDFEDVEELSKITYSRTRPSFKLSYKLDIFHEYLRKVLSNKMPIDEMLEGAQLGLLIKFDQEASSLKYFLSQKEKYQLRLNRVLKQRCSGSFYHFLNQPGTEKFLFQQGALPAALSEPRMNQETELQVITEDSQSVHRTPVVKKTHFFTKYLVNSVNTTKEHAEQIVYSFSKYIPNLLRRYESDPIRLKLLNLTDSEKTYAMENTLCRRPLPSDKEFIESVIRTAKMTLDEKYNKIGKYYFTTIMQYDYTASAATITIPQCIGYVKLLIDTFLIPLEEKVELLVTIMEQNPNLLKNKLKKENLDRPQLYEWVKNMTNDNIGQLFETVSGLDIEQIWREQKEFILLKHIYISATAYGEGNSACMQGVWSQIVASLDEIDFKLLNRYEQHLDRERDRERLMPTISRNNSIRFADDLARKLIEYGAFRPKVRKSLEEFVFGMIDMKNLENITFEQQQFFAQLHHEFTSNVKTFLPNYESEIPTEEEYDALIENVMNSKPLQDFVKGTSCT